VADERDHVFSSGSPGSPTSDWVIQGVGDFNGDGYADILWRNSTTGEVYIWLMNGSTFASSGSLGYVSSDWTIAGVGDFNGDGKADILWRNSTTGQVYLWLMNGTTMSGGGSVTYVSSGLGHCRASAISMAMAWPTSCGATAPPASSTSG
jgi:hypothetical protein